MPAATVAMVTSRPPGVAVRFGALRGAPQFPMLAHAVAVAADVDDVALVQPVVAKLTDEDRADVGAYYAELSPCS